MATGYMGSNTILQNGNDNDNDNIVNDDNDAVIGQIDPVLHLLKLYDALKNPLEETVGTTNTIDENSDHRNDNNDGSLLNGSSFHLSIPEENTNTGDVDYGLWESMTMNYHNSQDKTDVGKLTITTTSSSINNNVTSIPIATTTTSSKSTNTKFNSYINNENENLISNIFQNPEVHFMFLMRADGIDSIVWLPTAKKKLKRKKSKIKLDQKNRQIVANMQSKSSTNGIKSIRFEINDILSINVGSNNDIILQEIDDPNRHLWMSIKEKPELPFFITFQNSRDRALFEKILIRVWTEF